MIADHDRSGWFGASDVGFIVGKWNTKTFDKFWQQKMGWNTDHFDNIFTLAGTHYEHKILNSLGIPMELDKQILIPELSLRVNLDGNSDDTIFECKTYQWDKGWKCPKKYTQQVCVQMFASKIQNAKIIHYGLTEDEYDNYYKDIDPGRRGEDIIQYDGEWVNHIFLPRLEYLSHCLKHGLFPQEGAV